MKIKLIVAWYDFWIGFFWDRRQQALYFFPVPMFGIKVFWEKPECCKNCKFWQSQPTWYENSSNMDLQTDAVRHFNTPSYVKVGECCKSTIRQVQSTIEPSKVKNARYRFHHYHDDRYGMLVTSELSTCLYYSQHRPGDTRGSVLTPQQRRDIGWQDCYYTIIQKWREAIAR